MNKSKRLTHYMTVSPSSHLAQLHCVNCWRINEHESAAMSNLYGGKGAGLATQTSYKALKQSVLTAKHVDPVYFALVRYIDYEKETFDGPAVDSDGFSALMYKRKSFEHEHELGIVTTNGLNAPLSEGREPRAAVPSVRLHLDLACGDVSLMLPQLLYYS